MTVRFTDTDLLRGEVMRKSKEQIRIEKEARIETAKQQRALTALGRSLRAKRGAQTAFIRQHNARGHYIRIRPKCPLCIAAVQLEYRAAQHVADLRERQAEDRARRHTDPIAALPESEAGRLAHVVVQRIGIENVDEAIMDTLLKKEEYSHLYDAPRRDRYSRVFV